MTTAYSADKRALAAARSEQLMAGVLALAPEYDEDMIDVPVGTTRAYRHSFGAKKGTWTVIRNCGCGSDGRAQAGMIATDLDRTAALALKRESSIV